MLIDEFCDIVDHIVDYHVDILNAIRLVVMILIIEKAQKKHNLPISRTSDCGPVP
jgi:hypothetical protein